MAPRLKRKLDYSDYLLTPDDGKRYEIIRGELSVTPSAGSLHQRVSKRLLLQLVDYFEGRALGEVFHAPTDVILTAEDFVQPDLLVVADPQQVSRRGIEGGPLLVVEILSPSTRKQDRGIKAQRYAELGVRHYWIVDPESKRVECHGLVADGYRIVAEGHGDTTMTHPDWAGLVIDLALLWK